MATASDQASCFRILDLHTEIRLAIYAFLVSPQLERFLDLSFDSEAEHPHVSIKTNAQLTCLSLVCKQIKEEIYQMYPLKSLTLRTRRTLSWCSIPGPDPMVWVGVEPILGHFSEIIEELLVSEECARLYLDLLRHEEDDPSSYPKSKERFPELVEVQYDYPHPQMGLVFAALSAFHPIQMLFQKVTKLELSENILGPRYPGLISMFTSRVFPNLKCLNVLCQRELYMYESSETWKGIDKTYEDYRPNNEIYGWLDLAKSLGERGVEMLWSARCQHCMRCHNAESQSFGEDEEDEEDDRYVPSHNVTFNYTYHCREDEIIAAELVEVLEECACKHESRFKKDFNALIAREGLKIKDRIIDDMISNAPVLRGPIFYDDVGWDEPRACPVFFC